MSNAIDSLLVEIGFEVDSEKAEDANALLNSLRNNALKFGSTMLAGLGLGNVLSELERVVDLYDKMEKKKDLLSIDPQFARDLGYALDGEGGDPNNSYELIQNLMRQAKQIEKGEYDLNSLAASGFDTDGMGSIENWKELFNYIMARFGDLDAKTRLDVGSQFGLTEAQMLLFSKGFENWSNYRKESQKRHPIIEGLGDDAEAYKQAQQELAASIDGLSEVLSSDLIPLITKLTNQGSDWVDEISKGVRTDTEAGINPTVSFLTRSMQLFQGLTNGSRLIDANNIKQSDYSSLGDFLSKNYDGISKEINSMISDLNLSPNGGNVSSYIDPNIGKEPKSKEEIRSEIRNTTINNNKTVNSSPTVNVHMGGITINESDNGEAAITRMMNQIKVEANERFNKGAN